MSIIRYLRGGQELRVEANAAVSLLNALVRAGARIRHDCGGKALCGTCRVRVSEATALNPVGERERERLRAIGAGENERLACQSYAFRDVTIEGTSDTEKGPNV